MVLFANGILLATLELKTDFTQAVWGTPSANTNTTDRRATRDPQEEPLLAFKRRALVHFAVSSDEIHML